MRSGTRELFNNDLSQTGVGRRKDGGQDSSFPYGELRKHQTRDNCSKRDSQQHTDTQQANWQASNAAQSVQFGSARIREEQQD